MSSFWTTQRMSLCLIVLAAMIVGFLLCASGFVRLKRRFEARLKQHTLKDALSRRQSSDVLLQGFQGILYRMQAARDLLPESPHAALRALDVGLEEGDLLVVSRSTSLPAFDGSILGDRDFAHTLAQLGKELMSSVDARGVRLSVIVEGQSRSLKETLRDDVYRIAREALRNAFRHAKSTAIESEVSYGHVGFSLRIRDNGIGIGAEQLPRPRKLDGGLPGMREQAETVGGSLAVWSEYGAGTEIELSIPANIAFDRSDVGPGFRAFYKRKGNGRCS